MRFKISTVSNDCWKTKPHEKAIDVSKKEGSFKSWEIELNSLE